MSATGQGAASAAATTGVKIGGHGPNSKKAQALSAKENGFPKPAYSYSCLIALALKNSHSGSMSVSEIYKFMCEHFPYFKTAPAGWKNSVRHNLSLNKCFEKIEKPVVPGSNQRKGCLWAMNPAKINKMDEEVLKWSKFRYGVFEEHGYPGDPLYPMFYSKQIFTTDGMKTVTKPNFCTNTEPSGSMEDMNGDS